MSLSHRYRNFGGDKKPEKASEGASNEALEDQKLQAFDAGYKAGWDDAISAKSDETDKIREELTQKLLDVSFTYQEALSKLTVSMKPAIQQIVEKLLPETVRLSLGAHVIEQVETILVDHAPQSVELNVAPDNVKLIEEVIGDSLPAPIEIIADDSLSAGQAFIRIDTTEREVDLDSTIEKVAEALRAFFHEAAQGSSNE